MSAKAEGSGNAAATYPANREMETHRGAGEDVSVTGESAEPVPRGDGETSGPDGLHHRLAEGSAARGGGLAFQAGGQNGAPPVAGAAAPATAATVAAEARAPYRSGAGIPEKDWQGYKAFLKRQDPALSAKIESGKCLCCEPGLLRIGFEKGYFFLDDVIGRKAALAEHGRKFFGRETALEIETLAPEAGGSTNGRNGNGNGNGRAAKNQRIQEIRREALSHPLVRKILDTFPGAEVRDVRMIDPPKPAAAAAPPVVPPDDAEDLSPDPPSE